MPTIQMTKGKVGRNAVNKKLMVVKNAEGEIVTHQVNDQFSLLVVPMGRVVKRARNTLDVYPDEWFSYPSLRQYHGPSSIINILRFRRAVEGAQGRRVRVITAMELAKRTNAALLVGAYLVWWGDLEVEHVISLMGSILRTMPAYQTEGGEPFPDLLCLADCLRALQTFRPFIDLEALEEEEIQFWEDPDNGDMNWIIPGMFLAMAGPDDEGLEAFVKFAELHGVKAVVRLNENGYDETVLKDSGIDHLDLPFEDGSVPSPAQIVQFYKWVDHWLQGNGAVAVHCRAGLGRTGTMIGTYLVRKYHLPVKQVIAWCRIMRPGCFLTRQPRFMEAIQWWLKDEQPGQAELAVTEQALGKSLANTLLSRPFSSFQ